ncbi:5-methyltetrahydropteroyltriglutamate--homocysteine S-methyltransferase [Enterovibrio norvegicus FF-162]|uniref:5-methyltetrahydropteroyltriglutamate-- homocysteine S-methyltransferase n=1 Tax=Enterovibrio norvegicus TaxID=188144 RepID=UPI000312F575|nr:5-methyltetrahydropteroyltriglutamate--homocysteine S-methyltransferase [Enterovibrio norvegicus]OEE87498.1 5-methyltetrahydropteroyltriglutamate--homocysteine S-methyltransferase [Enterovibrio norvegicus FF-162]
MTTTHILGYPRIGNKRELKFALEQYWNGEINQQGLLDVGATIRHHNWQVQKDAGLSFVTVGDFAWYDQVLQTSLTLGHIPKRHRHGHPDLDTLFRIARGKAPTGCSCAASDMTKWFNTNYHYIVPEFTKDDEFALSWNQLFDEVSEAQKSGYKVKPAILGPISYLFLGKEKEADFNRLELLPRLLSVYQQILNKLKSQGVEWVQIDEPILALELPDEWRNAFKLAYQVIGGDVKLLLTTYFESVEHQIDVISALNVNGLHLDANVAPQHVDTIVDAIPDHWVVSLGVVNGRNIWKANLNKWLTALQPTADKLGDRLWISSSCSLLHSPIDVEQETNLEPEVKSWLAFAKQKVDEVVLLANALNGNSKAISETKAYSEAIEARATSLRVNKPEVQARVNGITTALAERALPYQQRAEAQHASLSLPLFPTTTIGSFPQTGEIRQQRRAFKTGQLSESDYTAVIQGHIQDAIERQEKLGLDVLVHGEPERNDMVEYFAEHLDGFAVTRFGWVQSYGSRCVKPAVIVGDISRPAPISVEWTAFAQSLTDKPVKGMLTGPVTILGWTFPREDISRQQIAEQIALALRDEVSDLQDAGIKVIQIDEPAIREGMPLKTGDWKSYLDWAVNAFKISAASATPETQIHTHMCYSEFNDIIDAVAALDADVITIETSRSDMELLQAFEDFAYPNEIGPGVYDIHSPNIPDVDGIVALLEKARKTIPDERLWVNPDCGLKTRNWDEVEAALLSLVKAAQILREEVA